MKKTLLAAAVFVAASFPALAQVGVSVSIGQPGFYGQINLGDFPQPQVIYPQPVIVQQGVAVVGQPLYLRVPPGHEKHWNKHCRQYNACGRPVYFVQNDWYNNVYAPQYRERHGHHDDDRGDDDDQGHGHGHGHGNGNGHGHGHGHD